MKALKSAIIHPYLFAIFPILSLFFRNRTQAGLSEVILPITVFVTLGFLLFRLGKYFFRDKYKSGVAVSFFMIIFFSYRDVYFKTKNLKLGSFVLGTDLHILVAGAMILAASSWGVKRWKSSFPVLTAYLNITALILVLSSAYNIGAYEVNRARSLKANKMLSEYLKPIKSDSKTLNRAQNKPDIYYIILDTYARADTLKKNFNYDNSKFIKRLEKKGFYVAKKSSSNYTFTQLSLASSLNMEHLNGVSKVVSKNSQDPTVPYLMISNNKVARLLKTVGYRFVHFSTGWGPTRSNKWADINYAYFPYVLDDFNRVLLESTALAPLTRSYVKTHARKRILYNFQELGEVPEINEPTFTFAHLVIPHQPYLFDRNGNPVGLGRFEMGGKVWRYKKPYLEQLIYANKRVEGVINKILKNSKTPPIIILQSDHGPSSITGWDDPSRELLNERMNILNAYYLPGDGKKVLYPSITPVNSFRLIFNQYFGAKFQRHEDKSYFSTKVKPYGFIDVTDRLK